MRVAILVCALALAAGLLQRGSPPPPLAFRLNSGMTWDRMLGEAQIVIVAMVERQEFAGPLFARPGERLPLWRMIKIIARPENVLWGKWSGSRLEFYLYMWGGGDWNVVEPGHRYVFFLMRERGALRAVRDYWRSSLEISSGFHDELPRRRLVSEEIAELLLTPGEKMHSRYFSFRLPEAQAAAAAWTGRWRTAKLLRALMHNKYRVVRIAACEQLTIAYWGQDDCWDSLAVGNGADLTRGLAVSRRMEQVRRRDVADPARWWKLTRIWNPAAGPGERLDELRLLTAHKDPRIRAKYCRFLHETFPQETDCGCSTAARQPDFSGTWKLSLQRSGPIMPRGLDALTILIDHRNPQIRSAETRTVAGKITRSAATAVVNGIGHTSHPEHGSPVRQRQWWSGGVLMQ